MKDKENLKILIGSTLIMGAGTGLLASSVGIFVMPVTEALAISRSAFLLINSITIFMSLLFLPCFPVFLKKVKPYKIVFLCGGICSFIALCYSFFNNIIFFYISAAISGIFINGISSPLISPILKESCNKKSELYLGFAFTGNALVSILAVPLIRRINENFGFRWGYRFIFFIGAAMCFFGGYLIKNCSIPTKLNEFSPSAAISLIKEDKKIAAVLAALFLGNLINLAIFNNLVSFLNDLGFKENIGAWTISLIFAVMIFAKPLSGYIFNKKGAKTGSRFLSLWLFSASVSALLLNYNKLFLGLVVISLGFSAAFNSIPALSFSKEFENSSAFTLFMLPGYLGSACGSLLAAGIFDMGKSYTPAWLIFSVLSLLACLFFSLYPERGSRYPSKEQKHPYP